MKTELTLRVNNHQHTAQCFLCNVQFEAIPPMVGSLVHRQDALVCIQCLQAYDPKLAKILSQMTLAVKATAERKIPTQEELLRKYAEREPKYFTQYDGFKLAGADYVMQPDREGHSLTWSETYELMSSPIEVRVLIPAQTTKHDAVSLLRKIARLINKKGIYREAFNQEETK